MLGASVYSSRWNRVASANDRPNVVILMSDDQRFDMIRPTFMPTLWGLTHGADARFPAAASTTFANAFVPNPQCCPSRASTLSGDYSTTTGVWTDHAPYGGFSAFDDKHTIAGDFDAAGYRTAMVGKYLNDYDPGVNLYVPPGWDRWFAARTGAYYDYDITKSGPRREAWADHYGSRPRDYSTRVFTSTAKRFVRNAVDANAPFFLYLAYTAPHGPSIPDPRDVGRFRSATAADTGTPRVERHMLEAAFGIDRSIDGLLNALPADTIVVYLSDNGNLWGESKGAWGPLDGKVWPYDESLRIPMSVTSLDGTFVPQTTRGDIVLNVDLRTTLTHAAGETPLTASEGKDWGAAGYAARSIFQIGHGALGAKGGRMYCGARESGWLYVRYQYPDGTHAEELYREPDELTNLVASSDQDAIDAHTRLRNYAEHECAPGPPGYSW